MTLPTGLDPALRPHLEAIWPATTHTFSVDRVPQLWRHRESYLLLPKPSRPGMLVPTAPAAVASSALGGFGAGATATARVRGRLLGAVGRLGVPRLVPGALTVTAAPGAESFLTHASELLGNRVLASVRLGPPRANRKPVLTLMRRDGTVLGYAKLGVNELTSARIEAETHALVSVGAAALGSLAAPELLAAGTWHTSPFLLLSPLETRSASGIDVAIRDRSARDLVAAFDSDRTPLSSAPWWQGLRLRLGKRDAAGAGPAEARALIDLMAEIDDRVGTTEIVTGAQHGDWTPWNLQTVGARTNVWDWERFATDVPIGLDQLHYEFHSATTFAGIAPRQALRSLRARVGQVLALHGLDGDALRAIWPVYLVSVGERFVTDRQEAAGSAKGPLGQWLLPTLREAVESLDEPA